LLSGCKIPPFNPKADARIKQFTSAGSPVTGIVFNSNDPKSVTVTVEVTNGVDTIFNKCYVNYYSGGTLIASISRSSSIYLAVFGSPSTPSPGLISGTVDIYIGDKTTRDYALNCNIKQMSAEIILKGDDVNDHDITVNGDLNVFFQ